MKTKRSALFCLLVVSMLSLQVGCAPAAPRSAAVNSERSGAIALSGAFALYPLAVQWADEYIKLYPGVRIDVTAGGAGKGMADTLSGVVDIGMVSREVKPEEISQGAFPIAVTKDAVFAVVSTQNPALPEILSKGIRPEALAKLWIDGAPTTWGELVGQPALRAEVHVYTRSNSAGAAEVWAKFLGGSAQEDLQGVGVSGDPGILEAVAKDALGIGYNNLNYAFDASTGKPVAGAAIVPLDRNGNGLADPDEVFETQTAAVQAVADGVYPSPPARVLYLVTKGKPSGVTADFLTWILTAGQKYVMEAGYIPLPDDQLAGEWQKLQ